MTTNLFKPSEDTDEETAESVKADAIAFFQLSDEDIKFFFDQLRVSPETFTSGKVAKKLNIEVAEAYNLYSFFLHTIHMNLEHMPSLESIGTDLVEAGCDKSKVETFVKMLSDVDEKTKLLGEILYFASGTVDDYFHIQGLGSSMIYRVTGEAEGRRALIPVMRLRLLLEKDDEGKTVDIAVPITQVEEIALAVRQAVDSAKESTRILKKDLRSELFVPEG